MPIQEHRVSKKKDGYHFKCVGCSQKIVRSTKSSALKTLTRGYCINCKVNYKKLRDSDTIDKLGIVEKNNKWCKNCSGCGKEQCYTRKDHAKQSALGDWLCKKCANFANKTRPSIYKGFRLVDFDKIERAAKARGLQYSLDVDDLVNLFNKQQKRCALSDVILVKHPPTWSIDRIDSSKDYILSNVQFVHKALNFMKGSFDMDGFITVCHLVTKKYKKNPNKFPKFYSNINQRNKFKKNP